MLVTLRGLKGLREKFTKSNHLVLFSLGRFCFIVVVIIFLSNVFLPLVFNGSQLNELDLSLPPGFQVSWTPDGRKYYIE